MRKGKDGWKRKEAGEEREEERGKGGEVSLKSVSMEPTGRQVSGRDSTVAQDGPGDGDGDDDDEEDGDDGDVELE